jgi:hypothetical protein
MIQIKPIYLVCLDEKMFATLKYFTGKIIQTCNVAWAPVISLIIYLLMHGFDPTPFQMKKVILVYKPCIMLQVKLIFFNIIKNIHAIIKNFLVFLLNLV